MHFGYFVLEFYMILYNENIKNINFLRAEELAEFFVKSAFSGNP